MEQHTYVLLEIYVKTHHNFCKPTCQTLTCFFWATIFYPPINATYSRKWCAWGQL